MTSWNYGGGGWVRIDDAALPGPLYARILNNSNAQPVVTELYLDGRGQEITGEHLAMIRPAALALGIERARPGELARKERFPGPDLSRLASHYQAGTQSNRRHDWVADSFHAQIAGSGVRQAPKASDPAIEEDDEPYIGNSAGGLTDEFLQQVAAAYGWALRNGQSPGTYVQQRTGTKSIHNVRAWFRKARSRGFLPAGKAGRIV